MFINIYIEGSIRSVWKEHECTTWKTVKLNILVKI